MSNPDSVTYFQAEAGNLQTETWNLSILEQPNPLYRLRYASEIKTSFPGALKGLNAPYPKVQLQHPHLMEEESVTETFIRVSVFTASYEPHVHKIATKETGTTGSRLSYPVDVTVSSQNDFQAELRNLIIIRRSKPEWIEEEITRQKNEFMSTDLPNAVELKKRAEEAWERLKLEHKLSQFRLGFYAYERGCPDSLLCGPLFSDVISDKDDASVGKLKITRMSACSGKSGEELILLVSKITKCELLNNSPILVQKDCVKVKVRFFEGNPNKPLWEKYAKEIDFHHQVALVVLVPEYREDIQAQVQVQLERTGSDGSINRSDARLFTYKPSKLSGKRRLSTPPTPPSSLVNHRRRTGWSVSEENIQVQRGGQQLNQVQSCPNVNWENQGSNVQSSLIERSSSSSQNMHQLLDDFHLNDGQEIASSVDPNHQQNPMPWEGFIQLSEMTTSFEHAVPQMEGYPSIKPNNQLNEALYQPSVVEGFSIPSLESIFLSPNDWQNRNVVWGVDLAADSTQEKKKAGKEKHVVVTDGIGNKNACGSTSSEPTKEMSHTSATIQPAALSFFPIAITGDARKLEKLMKCMSKTETKRLINETNEQEQTPLIIAVEQNHDECVKLLCSAGANVNLADEDKNTPYHIAAKKNYYKCLEMLLKVEDRELDKKNDKGEAALHLAVLYNSVKCVKMLIKAGANVNEKNCTAGSTALHLAVQHGYTELVRHLLEQKNIKIHEVNYADKTAAAMVKADQEDIISLFKELHGITVTLEEETTDEDE